jgi:predicted metal-dependent peptidase
LIQLGENNKKINFSEGISSLPNVSESYVNEMVKDDTDSWEMTLKQFIEVCIAVPTIKNLFSQSIDVKKKLLENNKKRLRCLR